MILCDLPCSNSEIHSCFGKFACKRLVLVLTRAEKNRRSVCCHANSHEPEVNNMFMLDEFCHMSIADWQKGGKNNAKDFEAATEAEAEALLHRVEIGAVSPQPVFSARVMQYHTCPKTYSNIATKSEIGQRLIWDKDCIQMRFQSWHDRLQNCSQKCYGKYLINC